MLRVTRRSSAGPACCREGADDPGRGNGITGRISLVVSILIVCGCNYIESENLPDERSIGPDEQVGSYVSALGDLDLLAQRTLNVIADYVPGYRILALLGREGSELPVLVTLNVPVYSV
jgi:hypothetical protein